MHELPPLVGFFGSIKSYQRMMMNETFFSLVLLHPTPCAKSSQAQLSAGKLSMQLVISITNTALF